MYYCSCFVTGISGYVSSNFYRKIGGTKWVWNVVLTTSIFSGKCYKLFSNLRQAYGAKDKCPCWSKQEWIIISVLNQYKYGFLTQENKKKKNLF